MIEPPIDPKLEAATTIIKGLVALVPIVGGFIVEVGGPDFNPLEKRKQQWMIEVSKALDENNRRFGILPELLLNDERFISFLYQATIIALKNHQRQKINALRNALVSIMEPEQFSEDLAFQFLRYIDELSVTHLAMLACFDKHAEEFTQQEELEQVYDKLQSYSCIPLDRAAFRSFLHDLDARFLIRVGDLEDLPEFASKKASILLEESGIRPMEVTSLGRSFLSFINDEDEENEGL